MRDRLTILFTNIWLTQRSGSDTVIRDLSLGMLRRGHRPIVYSPTLGEVADDLADRGIAVIDDLRKLAEPPDILHAHQSIPCGEALIRFPDVPAIQACHAFTHWLETPTHFPQIAAYVVPDEACRDRLVHAEGIDPARVLLKPNAVDMTRIPARPRPLMQRPQRAIAFGKAAAVAELRVACERLGIAFHGIGYSAYRPLADPERELVEADIVFASARCALESLCCGCAVVVCDARGIGGLVNCDNYEVLRRKNFGLRCLLDAITVERCVEEICRYDPADASRVGEMARRDADLDRQLDEFEQLYAEILGGTLRPHVTPRAHADAVARFLHDNLPRRPNDPRWPWLHQREDLQNQIRHFEERLGETSQARMEEARLAETAAAGEEMRRAFETRLNAALDEAARTDRLAQEKQQEIEQVRQQLEQARQQLDQARQQLEQARQQLEQVGRQLDETRSSAAALSRQLADLRRSRMLRLGRLLRRIAGRPVHY